MMKSAQSQHSASPQKSLRAAKDALASARLTAKASKARIRALKSEVKIQRKHYKWARSQVRAAKEEVAQWKATIAAEKSASEQDNEPKAARRRHSALEVERLSLTPVAPVHTDRDPRAGDG